MLNRRREGVHVVGFTEISCLCCGYLTYLSPEALNKKILLKHSSTLNLIHPICMILGKYNELHLYFLYNFKMTRKQHLVIQIYIVNLSIFSHFLCEKLKLHSLYTNCVTYYGDIIGQAAIILSRPPPSLQE